MESQMEDQVQLTNSKEIITYLAKHFPHCFTLEGDAKPLKVGIFQDIISRVGDSELLSKTKLRSALRSYTMSWRYLYSVKEGQHRVDLDGNLCEVITKEHVEHAQQQLKESKARAQAKRKTRAPAIKKPKALQVGDSVKVILSRKPIDVQVINIEKEHIRVKVASGMELTVKPEHIITK